VLTNLGRMSGQYGDYAAQAVSPLPLFGLVGAVVWAVWWRGGGVGERKDAAGVREESWGLPAFVGNGGRPIDNRPQVDNLPYKP
jgi:hypothetical protein